MSSIRPTTTIFFFLVILVIGLFVPESIQTSKGHVTKVTYFTLKKFVTNFKAVLVKFDETYPANIEKRDDYEQLAEDLRFSDDLLVAEMIIQDYPKNTKPQLSDEQQLATKLNATNQDQFPILFLFSENRFESPIRFGLETFDPNSIKQFVLSNVPGIRLKLESCIEELDLVAKNFIKSIGTNQSGQLLEKVQQFVDKIDPTDVKSQQKLASSQVYLKLMKRVLEKGTEFLASEQQRVQKLISNNKLTELKIKELRNRLNILNSFSWAVAKTEGPDSKREEL